MRDGATQCDDKSSDSYLATVPKYLSIAEDNDDMRLDATLCEKAGDGIRTHDVQLGKQPIAL